MTLIWLGGALIALGGALALGGRLWRQAAARGPRRLAQGALRMSRALRFAPLALLLLVIVALVWRLATPTDNNVPSKLEGKPVPAFDLGPALDTKPALELARPRDGAARICSTSSQAGACPASAK